MSIPAIILNRPIKDPREGDIVASDFGWVEKSRDLDNHLLLVEFNSKGGFHDYLTSVGFLVGAPDGDGLAEVTGTYTGEPYVEPGP